MEGVERSTVALPPSHLPQKHTTNLSDDFTIHIRTYISGVTTFMERREGRVCAGHYLEIDAAMLTYIYSGMRLWMPLFRLPASTLSSSLPNHAVSKINLSDSMNTYLVLL